MSSVYFGDVYQIDMPTGVPALTNFRLSDGTKPTNAFFTGIPLLVNFFANQNNSVGFFKDGEIKNIYIEAQVTQEYLDSRYIQIFQWIILIKNIFLP